MNQLPVLFLGKMYLTGHFRLAPEICRAGLEGRDNYKVSGLHKILNSPKACIVPKSQVRVMHFRKHFPSSSQVKQPVHQQCKLAKKLIKSSFQQLKC